MVIFNRTMRMGVFKRRKGGTSSTGTKGGGTSSTGTRGGSKGGTTRKGGQK